MTQPRPVLVVGAGPTGLTAALELSRLGVPVRIVDQSLQPSDTSRALAVQARTLELLWQRGVAPAMVSLGNQGRAAAIYGNGKQLAKVDLTRIPSRFNYVLLLPQNETERLLAAQLAAQGVAIERGSALVAFSQAEPKADGAVADAAVTAVLRNAKGGTEVFEASYLICAEGAHSLVRRTLNLPFKGHSLPASYALADLHIEGDVPEDELSIFGSNQGFLALFPMRGGRFRIIATIPPPPSPSPGDPARAAGEPTLPELQALFDASSAIAGRLHSVLWSSRFHINSRMLDGLRDRRIFFGGDAAHIHSPAGGQGMNTGIQDMINLGWKLAMVYHGQAPPALLDTYSEERIPVIRRVVSITERATEAINAPGGFLRQILFHALPFVLDFDAVQQKGAATISQVEYDYRASSLSETATAVGELRAGDRIPDIRVTVVVSPANGAGQREQEVLLYDLLDPDRFTLLRIEGEGATPPPANLPDGIAAHRIRPAADTADAAAFAHAFGSDGAMAVVRPDAYLGFLAGPASTQLPGWFNRHFALPGV